jgi:hypothetical protein
MGFVASDFGLLSGFGPRLSDFTHHALALSKRRGTGQERRVQESR